MADANPGLVEDILPAVKEYGPIGAGKLEDLLGGAARGRGRAAAGGTGRT